MKCVRTRLFGFVMGVALLMNGLYFARYQDFFTPDSITYVIPAQNLLRGKGFTDIGGRPEVMRTPGYPLLIAASMLVDSNSRSIILLQHVLNALLATAVSAFVLQLSADGAQGAIAGLLLAADLPMLQAANQVLGDTLFVCLLFPALWLIYQEAISSELSGKRVAVSGFLAGVSTLVKPIALYLALPVLAFIWITRGSLKLKTGVIFAMMFVIAPVGWSTRNYFKEGHFVFSYISSVNLLFYRAAGVLAISGPGDFYRNLDAHQQELLNLVCGELERLYRKDCAAIPMSEKAPYFARLGGAIVLSHPTGSAELATRGAAVMMFGLDAVTFGRILHLRLQAAKVLARFYTGAAALLSIVGAAYWWRRKRELFYLFFLISAYFMLLSAGAEAYDRFRVPIVPFWVAAEVAGLHVVVASFRRLGVRRGILPQVVRDSKLQEAGPR